MEHRAGGYMLWMLTLIPIAVAVGWIGYAVFGPQSAWLGTAYAIVGAIALAIIGWAGLSSWKRHEHTEETN